MNHDDRVRPTSQESTASRSANKPWPERLDLPRLLPEAPSLSLDLLPESLCDWIKDVSERMQVPPEMVAVPAMIALSSVVGRQVAICPKQKDDWLVVPTNFGAVVGRSATLKSPAQAAGLKPLQMLAAAATEQHRAALVQYLGVKEAHDAQIQGIKMNVKKAAQKKDKGEIEHLTGELTDLKGSLLKPRERRYKTNDPTVEKLAELLAENPNGLLLVRDELSGWLRNLEKWGREGDREFYLEAWSGDNSFDVDRIQRGTIHVPALCLSIIGGIQPGKLEKYVTDAVDGGSGDDGLLQRFQLAVYPDLSEWEPIDREPDKQAFTQAVTVFGKLAQFDPRELGASVNEEIPALRFSPQAQDFFNSWFEEHESRLRSGEIDCAAFEAHLGKYRSTMPSLALIIHLCNWAGGHDEGGPVSLEATIMAAMWCEFLESHARKIYAPAIRSDLKAAHALAKKIKQGKIKDGGTVRDIYRNAWSSLSKPQTVMAGLAELEECNWVKVESVHTGGRDSERVWLHPNFIKAN